MIDFNELIDKYLGKELKEKTIGRYYPSEVGGCMRKTWYSYKLPKETDVKLQRIFHAGNMLHEFVTDVIKSDKNDSVDLIDSEIPFKLKHDDFVISGRVDNLILVRINNEKYLVEVKSTKFMPNAPKEEHEMQLQLYMEALDVHSGIVLYIQKDNLETKQFAVEYNAAKVEGIIERFKELHKRLVRNSIPEAEAKLVEGKEWMCKSCPWAEECFYAGLKAEEMTGKAL